nr:TIGR03086 family metal-binding protein [uncultured Actinoplanes sp.]
MATQIGTMLAAAAAQTVPVVRGIRDDQLGHPTPCDDFQVRDLFNHLYQVVVNFQELAARKQPDFATTPDELSGDWRSRFAEQAGRLVEAWSDPDALEGVSPAMGMPQETVGQLILLDLTVHGWDLARATGQRYTPDQAAVRLLTPLAERMGPQAREMGVFGAPVEVAETAGAFERLLALTGRRATL